MRAAPLRLASIAIIASVAGFWALEVPAMALYPGGTWWDARAHGHQFWRNFLCDLEREVGLNGEPNPVGSRLATWAMLVLLLGFVPLWFALPAVFPRYPRVGKAVRALGLASALITVATVLMPSDRFGSLHGVTVIVASLPGLVATGLAVAALALDEPRPRVAAWLGVGLWCAALMDSSLYTWHLVTRVEGTPLVAVAQKVALLFLVGWMLAVALRARRA